MKKNLFLGVCLFIIVIGFGIFVKLSNQQVIRNKNLNFRIEFYGKYGVEMYYTDYIRIQKNDKTDCLYYAFYETEINSSGERVFNQNKELKFLPAEKTIITNQKNNLIENMYFDSLFLDNKFGMSILWNTNAEYYNEIIARKQEDDKFIKLKIRKND
jgi:hypothetical protein